MANQAALANTAIANKDFAGAIKHLDAALATSPNVPQWLIARSTAYHRLGKFDLALADADHALLAATDRGRREQMALAQMRRGISYHGLKRYGDARLCFAWSRKLNDKEKGLGIWQERTKADYERAGGDDAESNQRTAKEVPDKIQPAKETLKQAEAAAPVAALKKKPIRREWFQSPDKVTITIYQKNVPKSADIIIEEGSLHVWFPVDREDEEYEEYEWAVDPLFARIDPSKSSYNITPSKVEIILHKAGPSRKWTAIEGTEAILPTTSASIDPPQPSVVTEKPPSYPTSSKNGPKDWDKVVGNTEDDADDGDEMGAFFKKLYKDSDPDTRRAMMKSYQESNGTSLSTNWGDVGKGPVKTQPPEGLEAKKWET